MVTRVLAPGLAEPLGQVAQSIGEGVAELSFQVDFDAQAQSWQPADFDWSSAFQADGTLVLAGRAQGAAVTWEFAPAAGGFWVRLSVERGQGPRCLSMASLILTYRPDTTSLLDWWIPNFGSDIHAVGLIRVRDIDDRSRSDSMLRGAFMDSQRPGLFLGTRIPQRFRHRFVVDRLEDRALRFTCVTTFTTAIGQRRQLSSEWTWVSACHPLRGAIETFAAQMPTMRLSATPQIGWNSWDYYGPTVSLPDLVENMEAIRRDPILSDQVKTIVIDAGWEHKAGEWYPNYRFPGGLERAAAEIAQRGFVPGIWTSPVLVERTSRLALRQPSLLIKDQFGDPLPSLVSNNFILDPTHPDGTQYVHDLFTRLFEAGFRFFKVDYLDDLGQDLPFYQSDLGPYEVMRSLFATIRAGVTPQSHILGCSLPAECGPGCADSGRIGIDIHNHWSHVEWVADYLQLSYWLHNRIWASDPDFLIVRGSDTSREATTNVLNPKQYNPKPPRWRRGPDFTLAEARTWASLVMMAGGNVFLSDRLDKLTEAGQALLRKAIRPAGVAAQPLDLAGGARASLWLQDLAHEFRLAVVNWSDRTHETQLDFGALTASAPATVHSHWTGEQLRLQDGQAVVQLAPHDTLVLTWEKQASDNRQEARHG